MPRLEPVDHDPFSESKTQAPKLVPVDHDPFDKSYRSTILPLRLDKEGKTHLAVPGILEDTFNSTVQAIKTPGDVLEGKYATGSPQMEEGARNLAFLVAGGGAGNLIGKEASIIPKASSLTKAGQTAKDLGYNIPKNGNPEQIARAIKSGTERAPSVVGDVTKTPPDAFTPGGLSDTAKGLYDVFNKNKDQEEALYAEAGVRGAKIPHELEADNLKTLQDKADELDKASQVRGASEQEKIDATFMKQLLNKLGKPFQKAPETINIKKDIPEVTTTKNIKGVGQYVPIEEESSVVPAPDATTTTTRTDPRGVVTTKVTDPSKITKLNRLNKSSTSTIEARTLEKTITKEARNTPPSLTRASDLIAARKFTNEMGEKVSPEIFDLLNNKESGILYKELERAGKNDPHFGRVYGQAYAKSRKNASLYRDEGIAKELGLDEDSLRALRKSGIESPNQTSAIKLNTIADNLSSEPKKLSGQLSYLRRASGDSVGVYAKIARSKVENIVKDIGMNYDKVSENEEALRTLLRSVDTPEKDIDKVLKDLDDQARSFRQARISSHPVEALKQNLFLRALNGVLDVATLHAFGLVRSAAHSAFRALKGTIEDSTPDIMLKQYRDRLYNSSVKQGVQNTARGVETGLRKIAGPEVGAQLGSSIMGSGDEPLRITIHPLKRDQ